MPIKADGRSLLFVLDGEHTAINAILMVKTARRLSSSVSSVDGR
jgi:hypothetical protein